MWPYARLMQTTKPQNKTGHAFFLSLSILLRLSPRLVGAGRFWSFVRCCDDISRSVHGLPASPPQMQIDSKQNNFVEFRNDWLQSINTELFHSIVCAFVGRRRDVIENFSEIISIRFCCVDWFLVCGNSFCSASVVAAERIENRFLILTNRIKCLAGRFFLCHRRNYFGHRFTSISIRNSARALGAPVQPGWTEW